MIGSVDVGAGLFLGKIVTAPAVSTYITRLPRTSSLKGMT